jgi:hypothetical protein
MTQRTQKQRIHNDLPYKLRKHLKQEQRGDVPEVTSGEEGYLWRIAKGEKCDGAGRHKKGAFGKCHCVVVKKRK